MIGFKNRNFEFVYLVTKMEGFIKNNFPIYGLNFYVKHILSDDFCPADFAERGMISYPHNQRHLREPIVRHFTIDIPLVDILDNPGNTLSASNTRCHHSVLLMQPLHVVKYLNGELATSTSERMTQRNSTAIDIDGVRI